MCFYMNKNNTSKVMIQCSTRACQKLHGTYVLLHINPRCACTHPHALRLFHLGFSYSLYFSHTDAGTHNVTCLCTCVRDVKAFWSMK